MVGTEYYEWHDNFCVLKKHIYKCLQKHDTVSKGYIGNWLLLRSGAGNKTG